jgi:NitT/TauT family transport system ATP-binding protein/nitrate/nitrite transport system substrate-binding protein
MPPIRLGLLRLTDAAPVVLAAEAKFFAAEGLDVRLSVEPSWANLADKLSYGLLDAAIMLPPLALAVALGLREAGTRLLVPMGLSRNGNAVTLGRALFDRIAPAGAAPPPLEAGGRLKALIVAGARPRLAVVHARSTHHLLLRYWLAASSIDPEREVEISVIPPAEMVASLAQGRIDGFCAGAPWGAMAARAGLGGEAVPSAGIWRNHPEKCLAVRADWAAAAPPALQALLRALIRAAQRCDEPAAAPYLASLLAQARYIGVPEQAIAASLPGGGPGGSVFFAGAATYPWRSQARWFLDQMARWGDLPAGIDRAAAAMQVYRPDLHTEAARALGLPVPRADRKQEGGHDAPWTIDAEPAPIAMPPDPFCDGAQFPA